MAVRLWRGLRRLPSLLGLALLRFYQLVISPLLPVSCRYYPSCSNYAMQAVRRHGLIWGTALAAWRLLRCNPWTPGGVDDVPEHDWRQTLGVGRHRAGECLVHDAPTSRSIPRV